MFYVSAISCAAFFVAIMVIIWIGCVCNKCGAMRDIGHEWACLKTTTRSNSNYANRGSDQHNDPCYGASCDDCEHTVLVNSCSRCEATKDEYQ